MVKITALYFINW